VCAQHFLNFERRDLVAAGLDDIDARTAEQPIGAVINHRNITGAEPPVSE
jgi:hypothetical protein